MTANQSYSGLDAEHYAHISQAIAYLCAAQSTQPSLAAVAAQVGLSEFHLQRLFTRWVGVSPKRFLQFLTKERAKAALQASQSVLEASLAAGLSGPGRLHDLLVTYEAMTPGELKAQGAGLVIEYASGATPFGPALVAWTARGVCHLAFFDDDGLAAERELHDLWPKATLRAAPAQGAAWLTRIFAPPRAAAPLAVLLRGSPFQLKVWQALLSTEPGQVLGYAQLAQLAGSPKAARAVGSALAANTLGFLIPCHRVIRETGEIGQFRWGRQRKQLMQGWEAVHAVAPH
ncbi:methylated-DNA--[protein]-cysteine S-methyltransferase [Atopomonas sediminilitoris]|uniref:methylated-DNA--[protein]-cysteine S-methyltransferase n=1 Tax=Atopomonas sediminilitoris TaxID=2919919 RepID=UPI001F4EA516|nr:methylated-DNA--[protein]-cysteine S-methyltransferase [Atopomonas sediminilitoris]MCJ8169503.1 methylated-DNA--[protein]-cysteine S-methyltransferase [Atopomonas sediminilitoris]